MGGAHPNIMWYGYTYDTTTGNKLTLADITTDIEQLKTTVIDMEILLRQSTILSISLMLMLMVRMRWCDNGKSIFCTAWTDYMEC